MYVCVGNIHVHVCNIHSVYIIGYIHCYIYLRTATVHWGSMKVVERIVCPLLTTGSTEDTIYEDKIYSIPSLVNVEVDDGTVPMTTNPCYERIESTSDHRRALYANL